MAAVLHFHVDAIAYTGGMAYEQSFCDDITAYVGGLAPVLRFPGEEEMRSLAEAPCGCSTARPSPGNIDTSAKTAYRKEGDHHEASDVRQRGHRTGRL